jgi:hypothetical protein
MKFSLCASSTALFTIPEGTILTSLTVVAIVPTIMALVKTVIFLITKIGENDAQSRSKSGISISSRKEIKSLSSAVKEHIDSFTVNLDNGSEMDESMYLSTGTPNKLEQERIFLKNLLEVVEQELERRAFGAAVCLDSADHERAVKETNSE